MDNHLLGMRTELVEGVDGAHTLVIIEVTPDDVSFQFGIIGIGIGAVTATVDITADTGGDTYGITAIDITGEIITTIDILYLSASDKHTGGIAFGEGIAGNLQHNFVF